MVRGGVRLLLAILLVLVALSNIRLYEGTYQAEFPATILVDASSG